MGEKFLRLGSRAKRGKNRKLFYFIDFWRRWEDSRTTSMFVRNTSQNILTFFLSDRTIFCMLSVVHVRRLLAYILSTRLLSSMDTINCLVSCLPHSGLIYCIIVGPWKIRAKILQGVLT